MGTDRRTSGSDRPFHRLSIARLEGIFAVGRTDRALLRRLEHELGFRETERAVRLRVRVAKARAALPEIVAPTPTSLTSGPSARPAPAGAATAGSRPVRDPTPVVTSPGNANAPGAILSAWTAMEALSPQTYRRPKDMAAGDRGCVADLLQDALPWETGEPSRPQRRLYYLVILGAIPMGRAVERMAQAFGEDEEQRSRRREKAAIAAVLVDRNGIVVEENGIAVSSFAWALPLALRLELDGLGAWPEVEPAILTKLDGLLRRYDKDGAKLPLDRARLDEAQRWLAGEFGLTDDLVEPPSFALRIHHHQKAKHQPEATLLNSFFLGDLARAVSLIQGSAAPIGLRRYLGLEPPRAPTDLLANWAALEAAVAPAAMPLARWPQPGGHSLVLLQQAAVNLAQSELKDSEGLVAINGPPGTGKTTLLRDLVAASVLDRALAMAAFDDPEQAFTFSGETVAAGEKAAFRLYALAPSLKGHEIVVASSNNKAVENISRELPAMTAIGRDEPHFSYFRSVATRLQDLPGTAATDEAEEPGVAPEPVESWGLIAAVLGNRRNLAAFQQAFWWDDERSFRLYLKAAKGDDVARESRDHETGAVERRTPAVVAADPPPLPKQALAAWRKARERMLTLQREIDADLQALEGVRGLCRDLAAARHDLAKADQAVATLAARRQAAESEASSAARYLATCARDYEARSAEAVAHWRSRPGLVQRLFRTERATRWARIHAPLADAAGSAANRRHEAEQGRTRSALILERATSSLRDAERQQADVKQREARLAQALGPHCAVLGDRMVDDALFARGHDEAHKASPWLPDGLQRKREDLFAASLAVHRAFIDVAARRVYHNLGALMDAFTNGPPQDGARRKLLCDLWSTLHMAVPVVSTTFASVDRMLGALPAGSIGWLLIDEGGQAHPQAAIGAIMRAKRTVVVGDPLQIEPVVTMPERLSADLCRHLNVDRNCWAPPQASAQTVADRASRFQAAFRAADGRRQVGIPLLVHRRCQEPMFGLFNRIAYGGQMAQGTPQRAAGPIGAALGKSRWIDVEGPAATKWCPAEGEAVVALLETLAAAGVKKPDLFIVTPFRIVAQELRRRLEREGPLFATLELDPHSWVQDRVGTIHTAQGREADAVLLVLGAPSRSQSRARSWAAETPNIFNVALSRARETVYVVGSHDAWSGVGHGQALVALPRERIASAADLNDTRRDPDPGTHVQPSQQRRGPSL